MYDFVIDDNDIDDDSGGVDDFDYDEYDDGSGCDGQSGNAVVAKP